MFIILFNLTPQILSRTKPVFVNIYSEPVPVMDVGMQADMFLSASSLIPPVSPAEATFSFGDDDYDAM